MAGKVAEFQLTQVEAPPLGADQPRGSAHLSSALVTDPLQTLRTLRAINQGIAKEEQFVPDVVWRAQVTGEGDQRALTGCPQSSDPISEGTAKEGAPGAYDEKKSLPPPHDSELEKAIASIREAQEHRGLSLDLRSNPGGEAESGAIIKVPTESGVGIGQAPRLTLPQSNPFITIPFFGKEQGLNSPNELSGIVPDLPLHGKQEPRPKLPDCSAVPTS